MDDAADDRGSVLPLVAVWLGVAVLVAMAIVAGTGAMVGRARAQATADAAALAGAAGGPAAAQVVAESNDGTIVSYVETHRGAGPATLPRGPGRSAPSLLVTVVVDVDGATATAAAERFWPPVDFLTSP